MKVYKSVFLILVMTMLDGYVFCQTVIKNPIAVIREDGSQIQYYLRLINKESKSKYLLVILQGSDCNSVTKVKAINRIAAIYPDSDLLTVEKYGIDESLEYSDEPERIDCPGIYIEKDNPNQRVSDLIKVITEIKEQYNYDKIIVFGGSEGSVIANLLTDKMDCINLTILFGGGGRFFRDDVIHSMKYVFTSETDLNNTINRFSQFTTKVLESRPFDLSVSNHGYTWWRTTLEIDQLDSLIRIKSPVLIVQGSADQSASTEKATEMVMALKKMGKENIDYYVYPNYDHSLNLSVNDNSSEIVITDIKKWIMSKIH